MQSEKGLVRRRAARCFVAATLFASAQTASAVSQTWTGVLSSDWNVLDNWDSLHVPNSFVSVFIDTGGSNTISIAATQSISGASAASLVMNASGSTLQLLLTFPASLNFSAPTTLTAGTFAINSGAGSASVIQPFTNFGIVHAINTGVVSSQTSSFSTFTNASGGVTLLDIPISFTGAVTNATSAAMTANATTFFTGTVTNASAATLTLNAAASFGGAVTNIVNASLTANGPATFNGNITNSTGASFTINAGSFVSGARTITNNTGSTFTLNAPLIAPLSVTTTINNFGTWVAGPNASLGNNGAVVFNQRSGTLQLDHDLFLPSGATFNYSGGAMTSPGAAAFSGPGQQGASTAGGGTLVLATNTATGNFRIGGLTSTTSSVVSLQNISQSIPAGITLTLMDGISSPTIGATVADFTMTGSTSTGAITNAGTLVFTKSPAFVTHGVDLLVPAGGLLNSGTISFDGPSAAANQVVAARNIRSSVTTTDPLTNLPTGIVSIKSDGSLRMTNRGVVNLSSSGFLSSTHFAQSAGSLTIAAGGIFDAVISSGDTFRPALSPAVFDFTGGVVNGTVQFIPAYGAVPGFTATALNLGPAANSGSFVLAGAVKFTGDVNAGVELAVRTVDVQYATSIFNSGFTNRGTITLACESGSPNLFTTTGITNSGSITTTRAPDTLTVPFAIQGPLTNTTAGTITLHTRATIGSTLAARAGDFTNAGALLVDNTTVTFARQVMNTTTGTLTLDHSTTVFQDLVTNAGAIRQIAGTATFLKTFTNNGAYLSDPATNVFTSLVVGPTGYVTATTGDIFKLSGDFTNNTTMPASWLVSAAVLVFSTAATNLHALSVDTLAASIPWGSLELFSGQSLSLHDTDGFAMLSVNTLILDGGPSQLSSITSDGTLGISYQSLMVSNGNGTFTTTGPGSLPIGIPEPAAMGLAIPVSLLMTRRRSCSQRPPTKTTRCA